MMIWGGLTCLSACLIKPTLVTIAPDFGYVDGCIDVTIQGNHLGEKATGDVGGVELTNVEPAKTEGTCTYEGKDPDLDPGCGNIQFGERADCEAVGPDCKWDQLPDYAQDIGFQYTAQVGPAPGGKAGFQDVNLKVDGETLTIPLGFYYRECPASFIVDKHSPTSVDGVAPIPMAAGDSMSLIGCGLDPANVTVEYHLATFPPATSSSARVAAATTATGDTGGSTTGVTTTTVATVAAATGELVDDCSTARAHTLVPTGLAPGVYEIWLRHTDDTLYVSGLDCTARGGTDVEDHQTTTSYYGYTTTVTWLGDSPAACAPIFVSVGGR